MVPAGAMNQGYTAVDGGVGIDEMARYDEQQVAAWIGSFPKLQPYAQLFVEHQIEGALFLRLTGRSPRPLRNCQRGCNGA